MAANVCSGRREIVSKSLVYYVCGCGFKTLNREAAERHSDEYGHTLIVSGKITPTDTKRTLKVMPR